jgi:hypothetical protein
MLLAWISSNSLTLAVLVQISSMCLGKAKSVLPEDFLDLLVVTFFTFGASSILVY